MCAINGLNGALRYFGANGFTNNCLFKTKKRLKSCMVNLQVLLLKI